MQTQASQNDPTRNLRAQFMADPQEEEFDYDNYEPEELNDKEWAAYLLTLPQVDQTVDQPTQDLNLLPLEDGGSNSLSSEPKNLTADEGYESYNTPCAFDMDLIMYEAMCASPRIRQMTNAERALMGGQSSRAMGTAIHGDGRKMEIENEIEEEMDQIEGGE